MNSKKHNKKMTSLISSSAVVLLGVFILRVAVHFLFTFF